MQQVNLHEAKTHLSRLVDDVISKGDEVIICKAGQPLVRLVKFKKTAKKRQPGLLKGKIKISKDFDKLPKEFESYFK